jgi:hypothetical protein
VIFRCIAAPDAQFAKAPNNNKGCPGNSKESLGALGYEPNLTQHAVIHTRANHNKTKEPGEWRIAPFCAPLYPVLSQSLHRGSPCLKTTENAAIHGTENREGKAVLPVCVATLALRSLFFESEVLMLGKVNYVSEPTIRERFERAQQAVENHVMKMKSREGIASAQELATMQRQHSELLGIWAGLKLEVERATN